MTKKQMFKLVKVDKGECDMELYDLRVNHLCNPLGYEMNKTVFSWKVKNAVEKTGSCKNTSRRIGKF